MLQFSFFMGLVAVFFLTEGIAVKITNPFKPGTVLVNIEGNVKTLTRSTSCKAKNWGNIQKNACMCCIVKSALRSGGQFNYEGSHVNHCLQKGHCTENTLNEISKSAGVAYLPNDSKPFVTEIIKKSQVIPTAGTLGKEYHTAGKINSKGIIQALTLLAEQGKIKDSPESIKNCFNVEELSEKGSQTIQTFMVSKNTYCNSSFSKDQKFFDGVYIVKELGKGTKEIKNTTRVKESFLGQYNLTNPNRPARFPAIALDEISFTYKDQAGKSHYLAVLTLSPGLPVFKILKNFAESYKTHKDEDTLGSQEYKTTLTKARHSMASLGGQIGRLHATYMTRDNNGRLTGKSRAVHGDMHSNNIFEDEKLNVVFIDAETFALGLKSPRSVGKDILRVYLFSTIRNAAHQNARRGNVNQLYWHEQIIKPFLLEYVLAYTFLDGTYNKENFEDALRILRNSFSLAGSKGDPEAVFLKAGLFSSLKAYEKYIIPLLNEIEDKILNHRNPKELSLQGSSKKAERMEKPWRASRKKNKIGNMDLQTEVLLKKNALKPVSSKNGWKVS